MQSAGHVFTRHNRVAAAILVEAETSFSVDIAEVWSAIVRQTVRTSRDVRIGHTHSMILHAGPRLQRDLPQLFSKQRRNDIAIAAAISAAKNQTEWLGCVVDLGKTYRLAENFSEAADVFYDNLEFARSKVDYDDVIRGYWYEWSVAVGKGGKGNRENALGDVWLSGISLSDFLNPAPISERQATLSISGIGTAAMVIADRRPNCPFARALRASAYLLRVNSVDQRDERYAKRYENRADEFSVPHAKNVKECIGWLRDAVVQSGSEVKDATIRRLVNAQELSFGSLEALLGQ